MPASKPDKKYAAQESQKFQPICQGGRVDFPLRSGFGKALVLLVVGVPALLLSLKVATIARAAHFGHRRDVADLRRAVALDPGNAEFYHQLGLVYAYSLNEANLAKATQYLREATDINPRKALYWSDLAEVCDSYNNTACAGQAVRKAVELSPFTPRYEWEAGNHFLQAGKPEKAMAHFRRLLALDDTYAEPVFRICMRAVGNPQEVFQEVLPRSNKPELELAYLDFLSTPRDIDFANRVWNRICSNGFSGTFSNVKPYLECLIRSGDIPQAEKVWRDLEKVGAIGKPATRNANNLVYNGGFERTPLNAGFDWRALNTPYVETDFRTPTTYQGSRCLRVDYAAGQNLASEPVYELVPVERNQTYRLRAYVRSDDITSHSGPRLRVLDPECPACLDASTLTTVGTTPWHLLTLDFKTGANTRVVRLSVWRPRSRTFPMEISGSFWLDNVSIRVRNSLPKEDASRR